MNTIRFTVLTGSLLACAMTFGRQAQSTPMVQYMPREVYAGIETIARPDQASELAASQTVEILNWLAEHHAEVVGPSFVRTRELLDGRVRVLVGVPIAQDVVPSKRIRDGAIQEGFFVSTLYTGNTTGLEAAKKTLRDFVVAHPRDPKVHAASIEYIIQGDPSKPQAVMLLVRQ